MMHTSGYATPLQAALSRKEPRMLQNRRCVCISAFIFVMHMLAGGIHAASWQYFKETISVQRTAALADKVEHLPGWNQKTSGMYAGGPGCSGIGGAFLSEVGPFYPSADGVHLQSNEYSWSRVANLLFVDAPVGVGWSFSKDQDDYVTDDAHVAQDNYQFLLAFLDKFPQYAHSPLYIFGESYAGHFVPQLADVILRNNDNHALATGQQHSNATALSDHMQLDSRHRHIHLMGFAVINPWTDPQYDEIGIVDYLYFHGLLSSAERLRLLKTCNLTDITDPEARIDASWTCDIEVNNAVSDIGSLDPYYVLKDRCDEQSAWQLLSTRYSLAQQRAAAKRTTAAAATTTAAKAGAHATGGGNGDGNSGTAPATAAAGSEPLRNPRSGPAVRTARRLNYFAPAAAAGYDPCINDEKVVYLNRADVQAALHANTSGTIPSPWDVCRNWLWYQEDDVLASQRPVYKRLLAHGSGKPKLRVLVMSGDQDAVVPFTGTRAWVESLGLPVLQEWRPWHAETPSEVAGYVVNYSGLVMATVRGAGHMVPYTQPQHAFWLFRHFINSSSSWSKQELAM